VLDVNWLALLAAAIAATVLGFLWYSPVLFGNTWMKLMGWTKASMDREKMKDMQKTYVVSFVGAIVMAFVMSKFLNSMGEPGLTGGVMVAFWAWLGFVAPVQLTEVLFGGKKLELYAINTGYQLASLVVIAMVLSLWM
jgi:hypothetical protein